MRLIDANEFKRRIERYDPSIRDVALKELRLTKTVKKIASAQPEIIRCPDCKFYDGRPCGIVDYYNTDDDFCSRAERLETDNY